MCFDIYCIPNIPNIPEKKFCKGCNCEHDITDFNNPKKLPGRGREENFCKAWKKILKLKRALKERRRSFKLLAQ